jgi:hypothetical protein
MVLAGANLALAADVVIAADEAILFRHFTELARSQMQVARIGCRARWGSKAMGWRYLRQITGRQAADWA